MQYNYKIEYPRVKIYYYKIDFDNNVVNTREIEVEDLGVCYRNPSTCSKVYKEFKENTIYIGKYNPNSRGCYLTNPGMEEIVKKMAIDYESQRIKKTQEFLNECFGTLDKLNGIMTEFKQKKYVVAKQYTTTSGFTLGKGIMVNLIAKIQDHRVVIEYKGNNYVIPEDVVSLGD